MIARLAITDCIQDIECNRYDPTKKNPPMFIKKKTPKKTKVCAIPNCHVPADADEARMTMTMTLKTPHRHRRSVLARRRALTMTTR